MTSLSESELKRLGRVLAALRRRPDTWVQLTLLQGGLEVEIRWPGDQSATLLSGEPRTMLQRIMAEGLARNIRLDGF